MQSSLPSKIVMGVTMLCVGCAALLAAPNGDRTETANYHERVKTRLLFGQVQTQAIKVENESDQVLAIMRDPAFTSDLAWEGDSDLLAQVRTDVNKLNELVLQLREQQTTSSPIQRKVIAEIAIPSVELADTTQAAFVTLGNNETHLSLTDLDGLTNDIFQEAKRVDHSIRDFNKYVEVHREERQLDQELGLTKTS